MSFAQRRITRTVFLAPILRRREMVHRPNLASPQLPGWPSYTFPDYLNRQMVGYSL